MIGQTASGTIKSDLFSRKKVKSIYPHIQGSSGAVINIRAGSQEVIDGTVTWATKQQYTIGTDYRADFDDVDGRLVAVEFSSTRDVSWRLHGYQIEIEITGES